MCENHKDHSTPEQLYELAQNIAQESVDLYLEALAHRDKFTHMGLCDLVDAFPQHPVFTQRQMQWLSNSLAPFREIKPLYGDFKAIWVMFRLAGEHIKRPKIRLLTKGDVFLQLSFIQDPRETTPSYIKLFTGGWAGHGQRVFIGRIQDNQIIPHFSGAITEDIENTLQDFALDPAAVAKASALKLKACSFCGSRLSDDESKKRGYGPVCAENYGLAWGAIDEKARAKVQRIRNMDDLSSLFN